MMDEELKQEIVVPVLPAAAAPTYVSAVNNPEGMSSEELVLFLKDPK